MNYSSRILPVAVVLMLFVLSSCIKDKCGNIICYNEGVCVDGQCACPSGYEGVNCDTAWYKKFAGNWQADDAYIRDTANVRLAYPVSITGLADSFTILGLYDSLPGVICKRRSYSEFTVKAGQVMRSDSSIIIRGGEGQIRNGIVSGVYSFKLRDTVLSMKFTWSK